MDSGMESLVGSRIREYLEKLDPGTFGLSERLVIGAIEKLGLGESNLIYLVVLNDKKYLLRINMDPSSPAKSKNEYLALKLVEHLQIAPMAYHYEPSRHHLGETFIIIDYIDGISLDKIGIGPGIIVKLAKIAAKLHSTRVTINLKQQLRKIGLKEILQETKSRINAITSNRDELRDKMEIFDVLNETYQGINHLQDDLPLPDQLVLGHGDIDPQNVILYEGKLRLIDWEDLGLIDPALELVGVFDSFDFSDKHKKLFLEEYIEIRNDFSLIDRTEFFKPVQLFRTFCWAVLHVIEIKDGKMHEYFVQEQDLEEHISYARKMFEKCRKEGLMNDNAWREIDELFST